MVVENTTKIMSKSLANYHTKHDSLILRKLYAGLSGWMNDLGGAAIKLAWCSQKRALFQCPPQGITHCVSHVCILLSMPVTHCTTMSPPKGSSLHYHCVHSATEVRPGNLTWSWNSTLTILPHSGRLDSPYLIELVPGCCGVVVSTLAV